MRPTPNPLADFDSGFDSQLGFAVGNHCAPSLDCLGTLIRRLIGIAAVNSVKLADFCRPPGKLTGWWRPESATTRPNGKAPARRTVKARSRGGSS